MGPGTGNWGALEAEDEATAQALIAAAGYLDADGVNALIDARGYLNADAVNALIERFLERAWSELGLADNTLAGYRRDLEAFSRWLAAPAANGRVALIDVASATVVREPVFDPGMEKLRG